MPTKIQEKQNDLLWVTLGLIIVIALAFFYVRPQINLLAQAKGRLLAKQQDLIELEQKAEQLVGLDNQLNQFDADLKKLDIAVPTNESIDQLIVSLGSIATASGAQLKLIQPSLTGSSGQVTLNLGGSYSSIVLFLENLEKNLRSVQVLDVKISSASRIESTALVNATVTVIPSVMGVK